MSNEPEVDEGQYHGTQILWGRVLVLLLALALAFWLGTTFGGDEASQREISDQQEEIARLEAQIGSLEAELAAVDAGDESEASAQPTDLAAAETSRRDAESEPPAEKKAKKPADEPQDEGESYVIQSGDSLAAIAQDVYGDPTRWRDIARANDLREPYALTVGERLRIPEAP